MSCDIPTGALQLKGFITKIAIEKSRNIRITCCECCFHFIIILILVAGFNAAIVVNYKAKIYSDIDVFVPPSLSEGANSSTYESSSSLLDFQGILNEVLSGPLVVPTFDEYVIAGKVLSNTVGGAAGSLLSQTSIGRIYTNLLYLGDLHFAPAGEDVDALITYLNTTTTQFSTMNYYIHDSESDAVNYILDHLDQTTLALIVLREVSIDKVNYVIRQNYTTLPNTNSVIDDGVIGLDTNYQQYLLSGFLTLQHSVDQWVFNYTNVQSYDTTNDQCSAPPDVVMVPFPTPAYSQNPFYSSVGFLLGLAMVMATLYPLSRLVKSVVEEKETKMREVMKIMGLRNWVHQLGWFLTGFVLFFWIALSCTVITKGTFLVKSNGGLLFIYFFLFCISEINFAFLISVFFSNSKLSAIVAPVVLFASMLPKYIFINTNSNEQVPSKILTCLLSPSAFTFGADIIANFEYTEVGLQYSNMFDGQFNFGIVLVMMWLDFYIYGFLALYLDIVLPHEYGTSEPWWFFLNWRYWCPRKGTNANIDPETNAQSIFHQMPEFFSVTPAAATAATAIVPAAADANDDVSEEEKRDPFTGGVALTPGGRGGDSGGVPVDSNIEPIAPELRSAARVRIKNLKKRYPDGKLAVKDVSLSMLEGQITCLLGHNGAGKTTTIATLTGLIPATSGDVTIYGRSLQNDLPGIRQMTGICPQHNVLSPSLTVQEHLHFFGNVKGMWGRRLSYAIDDVIAEVGLTEKRNTIASALSGGMKRKLSLAIALLGDPKFVLLDEPTSGMDPYSRRSTWELLQKKKAGRVMLLTTHFMEEADTLADRIAIMSEGNLRCSGSALFLKSRFGVGYILTLSKRNTDVPIQPIEHLVRQVIPTSVCHSAVAGEVVFQLPLSSVPQFPALFKLLSENAESIGVGSYGISLTTLEQVFISLAKEAKVDHMLHHTDETDVPEDWLGRLYYRVSTGLSLGFQRAVSYFSSGSSSSGASSGASNGGGRGWFGRYTAVHREVMPAEIIPGAEMVVVHQQHDQEVGRSADAAEVGSVPRGVELTEMGASTPVAELAVGGPAAAGSEDIPVSTNESDGARYKAVPQAGESDDDKHITAPAGGGSGALSPEELAVIEAENEKYLVRNKDGSAQGTFSVQLFELFRKRLIVAGRDKKGFFFQVIFPAIQIILVLLILTVKVNPAGHTLTLQAEMYHKKAAITPTVNEAGASDGHFRSDLSPQYMDLRSVNVSNSTSLSEYLLEPTSDLPNRYGAYVFKDEIPLNVTVDWNWVQENAGLVTSNPQLMSDLVNQLSGQIVDAINSQNLTLTTGDLGSFNLTQLTGSANLTAAYNTIDDFLKQFNITLEQFNITVDNINTLSTGDLGSFDVTIEHVDDISYNATTNDITLTNVTVIVNGRETTISTIEVPFNSSLLIQFLPNGIVSYTTDLPSEYTVMHNSTSPHGIAAFTGELIQTVFRTCTNNDAAQYLIKNHPLPITLQQSIEIKVILSLLLSIFILVPLCYIPASFVSFIVRERVSKSKHLQIVSSVSPYLYWAATYLYDMFLFLILIGFIMAGFYIFGKTTAQIFISSTESATCLFLLLLTYGASSVPLSYIYSFPFENHSTAQISIMAINFMTGFVAVLAYYILLSIPSTVEVGKSLVHFFRFFPPYNIGEGLINLSTNYFFNKVLGQNNSYFAWKVTGRNIVFMAVEAVGYFAFILLTENSYFRRVGYWFDRQRSLLSLRSLRQTDPVIDSDVQAEKDRVAAMHLGSPESQSAMDQNALIMQELVKVYPPSILGGTAKHAVRGVSLACPLGERFGLLGINGAGKTSILSILTGDLQPTSGVVYIGGRELSDPRTKRMIGYCPQVDPLLDLMSGRETLWFFGRIRGIPRHMLELRISSLIHEVGLDYYADKPCGTYSGGNKRKLSLAVAMIGDPKVLFLDEPSTGMDPEARRQMWTVIEKVSANRSVVLVSHSMEEVEALCTRLGVMVSGRMQCLGSSQHLKGRFGGGYQVEVRCLGGGVNECLSMLLNSLNGASVAEQHGGYFRLQVPRGFDLSAAFAMLESNKQRLGILDYSISQCTLEQIFIDFAKEQEEETAGRAHQHLSVTSPAGSRNEQMGGGYSAVTASSGAAIPTGESHRQDGPTEIAL